MQALFSAKLRLPIAAGVIVLLGLAAYWNSFGGAFVLDDLGSIVNNQTIRHLWPLSPILLSSPIETSVEGRPLINLSIAINYAMGGLNVWGYHAVNLAVHILAALTLFGIVRRTLLLPIFRERYESVSTGLALVAALLWLVHPLQTESVTYIIQRAESISGLCYLLTIYLSIRAFMSPQPIRWLVTAVAVCWIGITGKEILATAPVIVLLFDRTFISGSFREALRKRWGFYLAFVPIWGILAALLRQTGIHRSSAGFSHGVTSWDYAITQFPAIVHYLRLSLWPDPLILDYGTELNKNAWEIVPSALILGLLLVATVIAVRVRPRMGFVGAWFFVILIPSSTVVPLVTQTIAEHRMYLPLAAITVTITIMGYLACLRFLPHVGKTEAQRALLGWLVPTSLTVTLIALLAYLTATRNSDYQSRYSMWKDIIAKRPNNSRAHCNFGNELLRSGDTSGAIRELNRAIELRHDNADAYCNLGAALAAQGRLAESMKCFEQALQVSPNLADAHVNLGLTLVAQGRATEAIEHYQKALQAAPNYAEAEYNLANALVSQKKLTEAIECYRKTLQMKPDHVAAHNNLGGVLLFQRNLPEAIAEFETVLRLQPDQAEARKNLDIARKAADAKR